MRCGGGQFVPYPQLLVHFRQHTNIVTILFVFLLNRLVNTNLITVVQNASSVSVDEDMVGVAAGEQRDPSSSTTATRPLIFGGLGLREKPQPLHSPESTAPQNRRLRVGLQTILAAHDPHELTIPLQGGAISISIPVNRFRPEGKILARATMRSPAAVRERHLDDGSLAFSYLLQLEGETRPWLMAMQIARDGKVQRVRVLQESAPGRLIELAYLRFDGGSKFESLPPEITDLIDSHVGSSGDLGALAMTKSTMTRKFAIRAELVARLEKLVVKVLDMNRLNRVVVNVARDMRLCNLDNSGQPDVDDTVSGMRLTGVEKGHLFEMLAMRIPSLLGMFDDGVTTPGEERILARLVVLSANDRLPPGDRGDLSALGSGRLFGDLRSAISGGVAVSVAVATFADGNVDDPELQALAIPAAQVLIMTGSTWVDAAKTMGIAQDHAECDTLRHTAVITVVFQAALSTSSIEDVRNLADVHGLDKPDCRQELEDLWADCRHSPETLAVLNGERPEDFLSSEGGIEHPDELADYEGMLVIMKAPALRRQRFSPEQIISSLGITHPLSCHMARRIHSESLQIGLLP